MFMKTVKPVCITPDAAERPKINDATLAIKTFRPATKIITNDRTATKFRLINSFISLALCLSRKKRVRTPAIEPML